MTITLKDLSNISTDHLIWIKKGNHENYYIEHRANREHSTSTITRITKQTANELTKLKNDTAFLKTIEILGM